MMRTWRVSIACAALATFAGLPGTAAAQTMWWVEGDRFCGGFSNNFRNNIMCGAPRRGETTPNSTFRYEFNTPSYNLDRETAQPSAAGPPPPASAAPQPGARAPRRN